MRKRTMLRSALAMGMAISLAAAPLGYAAAKDETEVSEDVKAAPEEAVEVSVEGLPTTPQEGFLSIEFGDALYNVAAMQDGTDISWLKDVYLYGLVVPGEKNRMDLELAGMVNGTDILDARISMDPENKVIYCSIPQLFEQPVALNVQSLIDGLVHASSSAQADESSMGGQMIQMLAGMGSEIASQIAGVIQSIPAQVWQEEVSDYLTPVMNCLVQESGEDTLKVGSLSAKVETVTYRIPPEKMGGLVSGLLNALANDKVVETILESDAVSNALGFVSMITGQDTASDGSAILKQYRSTLEEAAKTKISGIPGISLTLQKGTDKSAAGIAATMESDGESTEIYTFKGIFDGTENAFEFIPGEAWLSMYGLDPSFAVDIQGGGSIEGGFLNELIEVVVDDETTASFAVENLDLNALQNTGALIGSFLFYAQDMNLAVTYGVDANDVRFINYTVNDELFYHADYWGGEAEAPQLGELDVENAVEILDVEDFMNWIGTFNPEGFMEALSEAGIPVGSEYELAE